MGGLKIKRTFRQEVKGGKLKEAGFFNNCLGRAPVSLGIGLLREDSSRLLPPLEREYGF
jgi:hypothetical protein